MTASINPEQGIYRANTNDAWYVKPIKSGVSPKPFYDVSYEGNPELSYQAALAFNRTIRPFEEGFRNVLNPKRDKHMGDELPVGVSLSKVETLNKGGKGTQTVYNLRVSLVGLPGNGRTVYVGTENTWRQNLPAKIQKAIEIRDACKDKIRKR